MRGIKSTASLIVSFLALVATQFGLVGALVPARAATTGGDGWVVFESKNGPHVSDIWLAGSSGGAPTPHDDGPVVITRRLDKAGSTFRSPVFSPEGGPHVAFSAGRPGDIWFTTPRGLEPVQVTNTANLDEEDPNFSPGGGNIVFERASWNDGKVGQHDVYAATLTGANDRVLLGAQSDDIDPAWSQDLNLVAFASDRTPQGPSDPGYGIYVVDLRSAWHPPFPGVVQTTQTGTNPNWNPSQKQIVYQDRGDIWLVNVDSHDGSPTSSPLDLTNAPNAVESNPQFRPHGDGILYDRRGRLWAMRPDGSRQHVMAVKFNGSHPDEQPACNVGPRTDHHDVMKGSPGPDLFCPSTGGDVERGLGGNDVMFGGSDHDVIYGGAGNDLVQSGGNRSTAGDLVQGNGGDDTLIGSPKDDTMYAGTGSDRLVGQEGNDKLYGNDGVGGNDTLEGSLGGDYCTGDRGDDLLCETKSFSRGQR